MNRFLFRRQFCRQAAAAILAGMGPCLSSGRAKEPARIGFGFRLYGMQSLKPAEALRILAEIGYDGVQLELRPGWGTEPRNLTPEARRSLRDLLTELRLGLPALNESLTLVVDPAAHRDNLERIRLAGQLFHDLAPGKAALLETVLGGKTENWERDKGRMVDALNDWAKAGAAAQMRIAVKAHVGSAMDRPERCLWLHSQVNSPWIKLGYDYSHFALINVPLAASLRQMLPQTAIIHVKDSAGTEAKHDFLLPGDGKTDYVEYFKILNQAGYQGYVVVEVSAQIHRLPGYDPIATAKRCYSNLAPAFTRAGVIRSRSA